ncbi:MAG: biotin--[acetyl-CoA-carboxylase] ligase [Candidatus Aminicenantes bacterium]|nr:biotin--[acetyl-CoA-carboxylase] ligase [Candidatus Aminicenantes bacterium]
MTTCLKPFNKIHLVACDSTNDYIRQNIARLESEFPLMVSSDVQIAGRGREKREWVSPLNLAIYATFGFHLANKRDLSLLSITCGVAVSDMLQNWTGKEFTLKWPNDILADGKKIAGILCETIVNANKIICLAGIGVNVNQDNKDFPGSLRSRAGSVKLLTGKTWLLAEGRARLAASMACWLGYLIADRGSFIIDRARVLSRSFLGRAISFHHQGKRTRGIFLDIAADGGLLLDQEGAGGKVFYSGELDQADFS